MEDSGIDSEDKISTKNCVYTMNQDKCNEIQESDDEDDDDDDDSSNNVEVIFKHPGSKKISKISKPIKSINSPSYNNNNHNLNKNNNNNNSYSINASNQLSTCRILQRKLELKVERAKRNYNQYQEENAKKTKSSTLIPINRLQIPGYTDNQPLVEYKSDSEDADEISFFPQNKLKISKKHELTDTFSIQEMSIESDDNSDDSGSQNLELLPPSTNYKFLDKLLNCFYCNQNKT